MPLDGRRIYRSQQDTYSLDPLGNMELRPGPKAGDFWFEGSLIGGLPNTGGWYGITPNGLCCNLTRHQITQHVDGSITVKPSIKVTAVNPEGQRVEWHGYLDAGRWVEC